eukprot:3143096-Pleurochrysis_carterae.AAC.1
MLACHTSKRKDVSRGHARRWEPLAADATHVLHTASRSSSSDFSAGGWTCETTFLFRRCYRRKLPSGRG